MDPRVVAIASLLVAASGCSSVGSSAVRSGAVTMPPYSGPVVLYAAGYPVQGTELGFVEVHGSNTEGSIESLVPLFVERVAQLGGNAAVIDDVRAYFEIVPHPYSSAYGYGWHMVFVPPHAINDEVMIVSMRGRAFLVGQEAAHSTVGREAAHSTVGREAAHSTDGGGPR
jgi:hypothetical protein